MFFYSYRDNFIYNFHTGTMMLYIINLVFLASVFTHPLYLVTLLLSVFIVAFLAGCFEEMKSYFKVGLPMAVLIMIINPLISREGRTIIFQGPVVPVLGKLDISLEALLYGGNMGVRLMVIIGAFGLFNLLVDPDKFLSVCSRFIKKSAVTISLATRMVPNMARRLREIKDIFRTRGVNLSRGTRIQRVKNMMPLMKVLIISSLEDTFKVAESIQARGFGGSRRSVYSREKVKPRDIIVAIATIIAWVLAVIVLVKGWGAYHFYPSLVQPAWGKCALFLYIMITIVLMTPAILSLGCERWPFLRYKI